MFRSCLLLGAALFIPGIAHAAPGSVYASVYTDLYGKACTTVRTDKASGASTRRCSGVGGYHLLVHDDGARSSIDIITPGKQVHPLEYWDVVTLDGSTVGRKAEWRTVRRKGKTVPLALVVRLNTVDNSNIYYPKQGALIAVSRISADGACVIHRVAAASRKAGDEARSAASDPSRKCLGLYRAAAAD